MVIMNFNSLIQIPSDHRNDHTVNHTVNDFTSKVRRVDRILNIIISKTISDSRKFPFSKQIYDIHRRLTNITAQIGEVMQVVKAAGVV
jgi:hypothetical protein